MTTSKKKFSSRKYLNAKRRRRGLIFAFLVVGSSLVVWGFFLYLSQLGPKKIDIHSSGRLVEKVTDLEERLSKSIEFEEKFEATTVVDTGMAQDLTLLKSAIDLQTRYLESLPQYEPDAAQRLQNLERRYQNILSAQLKATSLELETEACKLAEAKNYSEASSKFNEAFELQRSINQQYPMSSDCDAARLVRLQRQAQQISIRPLLLESFELEKKAERLIDEKDIESATSLLKQAIAIQESLYREYRDILQPDVRRLEKLKEKLVNIESIRMHIEIQQVLQQIAMQKAKEDISDVADLYKEAARLQASLNKTYPESPYASSGQLAVFQKEIQDVLSSTLRQEIEKKHDQMELLLAERRTQEAIPLIVELGNATQQMKDEFPLSSFNDKDLQKEINYLMQIQSHLESVQNRIYDRLLLIPGLTGIKMFCTEVPQELYIQIIHKNPSRNRGNTNPVDSVSWAEAMSFCEHLSWILGKEVRLPSEAEFRRAVGDILPPNPNESIWSASNTSGTTQPVGQKNPLESGFYDLLGNLSEWLNEEERQSYSQNVDHIGGHVQDNVEVVLSIPVRNSSRNERNRLTGFRFVVVH